MNSKSIFKSKTAVVNFIAATGVLCSFLPFAKGVWIAEQIKAHAATILVGLGYANIALRFITHGRVSLFSADE